MIDWNAFRARTAAMLHRFDVRASGPYAVARTLSGGNQQKALFARSLEAAPRLLLQADRFGSID